LVLPKMEREEIRIIIKNIGVTENPRLSPGVGFG
jgi:hypothetical protein